VNHNAFNGDICCDLAAQFLALAEKRRATVPLMIGHRLMGTSLLFTGDIATLSLLVFSTAKNAGPLMVIVSPPITSAIYAATGSPNFERPSTAPDGELVNIRQTAVTLGVAASTIHRWLNEGIIAGEQLTPGAPWRIRLTDDLRALVAEEAPRDYLTVYQTMRLLRVSRQTVWQRVKRGEIHAIHVRCGRKKGLRLKVIHPTPSLFDQTSHMRCSMNLVQVFGEIGIYHVGVTPANMPAYFLDRIHRPMSRAIAVGIVFEVRLEDWFSKAFL
jgi:predicted DNA-binding transcriptional regulator AlpA